MRKILHHGLCTGEFEPKYIGTDYFDFFHKPCFNKQHRGLCDITSVLVDNSARVVFNLVCKDCGKHDALKTSPQLFRNPRLQDPLKIFYLSPKLKGRIKKHWWDDS